MYTLNGTILRDITTSFDSWNVQIQLDIGQYFIKFYLDLIFLNNGTQFVFVIFQPHDLKTFKEQFKY